MLSLIFRSARACASACALSGLVRLSADTSGELFALDGESVWVQRGRRVYRWDGSRERDDGNPKQMLASLVLRWSNR